MQSLTTSLYPQKKQTGGELMTEEAKRGRRSFSIELHSKTQVERISIPNDKVDSFLIEGSLGELINLGIVDGEMLEITGSRGTLRTDLRESELVKALHLPVTQFEKCGDNSDADKTQ
jgi:hypothetical protein